MTEKEVSGKDKQQNTARILQWLIAVLIFGVAACCFSLKMRPTKDLKPDIVVFGDSIYGEYREEDCITGQVSQLLHKNVLNGALGGTRMARRDAERRMDFLEDGLSMAALSKAVVTGDFRAQQMIHLTSGSTAYFDGTIDELDRVDFSKVGMLIIGFGLNDYQNGVPLDDEKNPYNEYTFGGAVRSVLQEIRKRYPGMRIILTTSTYSWYRNMNKTCEEFDAGFGPLENYVNLELKIAKEFQVEILDLYHDFYPHETWEDWMVYTRDGLHPNQAGRELIARTLAEYLEENP